MRFECIVAGTDGSRSAMESVRQAALLAAQSGATFHVVGAYRDRTWSETKRALEAVPAAVGGLPDPRAEMGDILDDTAYALRDYHPRVWLHPVKADPSVALADVAARTGAELIVVGNRGIADPLRRFRRPVCQQIRKHANCRVLVVDTAEFWNETA
jgi:nucleotide-binding universal stress UspA family protein